MLPWRAIGGQDDGHRIRWVLAGVGLLILVRSVDIDVTLQTGNHAIRALQFSFGMPPLVRVEARRNAQPRCVLDPQTIDKAASFAFQPPGCIGDDSCQGVAGLVYRTARETLLADRLRVICTLQIAREAHGSYVLEFGDVALTTDDDIRIAGEAVNGRVEVGGPLATPTPTPDRSEGPSVVLGRIQASAGARVAIRATLLAHGFAVAGVQVDFAFPPEARVVARDNGRPDCRLNPDFGLRGGTSFAYRPSGCMGDDCTGVRALVLSIASVDPIPDGSELFTCVLQIAEDAVGTYALLMDGLILSDANGSPVTGTTVDGAVTVDDTE